MKKSLLLTALIASVASLAATTGKVEFELKNEMKSELENQQLSLKDNKSGAKLKTEVKVKNSGFSFGTELGLKNITLFKLGTTNPTTFTDLTNTLKEKNDGSKLWAKYELPELKGFQTSVKGEYNIGDYKLKAEADAHYTIKDKVTFGYNTTHEFKLLEQIKQDNVISTQKVYLNVTNPKFVDTKAEAEVKHDWQFDGFTPKFAESVKDVKGELAVNYKATDNFTIGGEAYIKYINFVKESEKGKYKNFLTGKKDDEFESGLKNSGSDALALNMAYTKKVKTEDKKDKDLFKLENKIFLQHIFENESKFYHSLYYGTNLKTKYTGVDNLTLTSDTTLGGISNYINETPDHTGYIKVDLGAKYDYNLIDKITLTPELNAKVTVDDLTVLQDNEIFSHISLEITPKLAVAYKPIDKFSVTAKSEFPITFNNDDDFKFKNIQIKPSVNVKYEW